MKDQQKVKKTESFLLITVLLLTTFLTSKALKKVNIQDLRIYGSELFTKEDIASNSSLKFPIPLILVRTKYIEEELKENLSLENVSVIRQILPFGLKILIKTRTPIAYGEKTLNGKRISGFIDKDGFFINEEKYFDNEIFRQFSTKVFGWTEKSRERLSTILNFQKNNNIEFTNINFSPNGFLTLEEKSLKTIFLGFDPKLIETQLLVIIDLKNQLMGNSLLQKINTIDLTDPSHPKIKVFKP